MRLVWSQIYLQNYFVFLMIFTMCFLGAGDHSDDGSVYSWGANGHGQLGQGHRRPSQIEPMALESLVQEKIIRRWNYNDGRNVNIFFNISWLNYKLKWDFVGFSQAHETITQIAVGGLHSMVIAGIDVSHTSLRHRMVRATFGFTD